MNPSDVAVVVVSYNTCSKLHRCLSQIDSRCQVIVVDNASIDGSADMVERDFPWVLLVRSERNLGFGPANNVGARAVSRPLILFLNSDAYVEEDAIARLAAVFDDSTIVGAGAKLLNMDGSLQQSTANKLTLWSVVCEQLYLEKLFPRSRFFSPYWTTSRILNEPEPAESAQVMGACMMVRGGLEAFDERFFLYCEDTDLCLRLRRHGRIVYVKGATVLHELGSSSSGSPVRGVYFYNRGKELYFLIHGGKASALVCGMLNRIGSACRAIYWQIRALRSQAGEAKLAATDFWRLATGRYKVPY